MVSATITNLYHRFAPRWIKVIRWDESKERTIKKQKFYFYTVYLPAFYILFLVYDDLPVQLYYRQPRTKEELLEVQKHCFTNPYTRNWGMDQYKLDYAPLFDLAVRRAKYPEHYGDKYNGFYKDDFVGRSQRESFYMEKKKE